MQFLKPTFLWTIIRRRMMFFSSQYTLENPVDPVASH